MIDHPFLRIAFRIGDSGYRFADAVWLSVLTGTWTGIEASLRHGQACASRSAAEGFPLGRDAVPAALRDFRYRRNLIAAEEAEAWLAAWDLDVEAWKGAVTRGLLAGHWHTSLDVTVRRYPPTDDRLAETAWADLVCSGRLETLVHDLAERVAVAGDPVPKSGASRHDAPGAPGWLRLPGTATEDLKATHEAFEARRRTAISPESVTAAITAHPLDWTCFDLVRAAFPGESMAAEAALRVREDGERLEDVAREVGQPLAVWRGFLAAADEGMRARIVGSSTGDLLGPLVEPDAFALIQIVNRRSPRADDAPLRDAVAENLWSRVAARAMESVRWEFPREGRV